MFLKIRDLTDKISNLIYFNHALNVSEILDIVNKGPNLKHLGDSGEGSFPPYFALRWYFMTEKIQDTSHQKNNFII